MAWPHGSSYILLLLLKKKPHKEAYIHLYVLEDTNMIQHILGLGLEFYVLFINNYIKKERGVSGFVRKGLLVLTVLLLY